MTRRDGEAVRYEPGAVPQPGMLSLPEGCSVRVIDLPYGIGAAIAMDEDGYAGIYLNARLDHVARQRALSHELWHYYRDDMYREADIREIERAVPRGHMAPVVLAMDGSPLAHPAPAFAPEDLKRVGRGLYLPVGKNREKAARSIRRLCELLDEACRTYDVRQWPPLLPAGRLREACGALRDAAETATAFIAWRPAAGDERPAMPVVQQFCSDDVEGAIYYDARGDMDNAVARVDVDCDGRAFRLTIDICRRRGSLAVESVYREVDGGAYERVF